jgi:4a-hydroxytetrahydrobiopterin dehydratase
MNNQVTPAAFEEADGLQDWRVISEGGCIFFRTASFTESVRLAQAIGELPGIEEHPPAVDIRAAGVLVRVISLSHDYMGMTETDVEVAQRISALGRDLGLAADPSAIQGLLVIPGASDIRQVMPFWQAVLGYQPRLDSPDEDLVDPQDRGAPFWFEKMDEPRSDEGGAIHISVWIPLTRRRRALPRRSPPEATWSATTTRRRGGRWPMPPATRSTSRPPPPATESGA